jgi:PhoH-like ATPase
MAKTYVLDTSALIYDPTAWKQFPHSDVIIPIVCLNELDKLKKQSGEAGRNARVCIRYLDEISDRLDISSGIELEDGIMLKIDTTYLDLANNPAYLGLGDPTYGDTQILACAIDAWNQHPEHDVTLVSNDINLRVKAKSRNIDAIGHDGLKQSLSDMYAGCQVVDHEEAGVDLLQSGQIDPRLYGLDLNMHECVLFQTNGDGISMGRKVANGKLKLIRKVYPWGISSRNKEQSFAMDILFDKNVDLVTLVGKAGTGKSLVALAVALELVLSKKEYERLVIYRPIQAVGNDIGFLPGTKEEKLEPWFQAILDSFELLLGNKPGSDWKRDLEMFKKKGRIEMEAIAYIRGRSIPNAIMLIDEAQNLTQEEVKTILTRAGEGTKIILTGDVEQIDNSSLDATNNGLSHIIEKFKDSEMAGHITFTEGERSRLASKASEIL